MNCMSHQAALVWSHGHERDEGGVLILQLEASSDSCWPRVVAGACPASCTLHSCKVYTTACSLLPLCLTSCSAMLRQELLPVGNHAFAREYNKIVPDTWGLINDQVLPACLCSTMLDLEQCQPQAECTGQDLCQTPCILQSRHPCLHR